MKNYTQYCQIALALMILIAVVSTFPAGNVSAAPLGYPWFNTTSDVRVTFNTKEAEVFDFVTARLIAMKDHPNATVNAVADAFRQQFVEEFDLVPVGTDIETVPKFSEELRIVKEILFRVSDPANGGNADVVLSALRANIIIVEPTP